MGTGILPKCNPPAGQYDEIKARKVQSEKQVTVRTTEYAGVYVFQEEKTNIVRDRMYILTEMLSTAKATIFFFFLSGTSKLIRSAKFV